jgi:hypothetical protein
MPSLHISRQSSPHRNRYSQRLYPLWRARLSLCAAAAIRVRLPLTITFQHMLHRMFSLDHGLPTMNNGSVLGLPFQVHPKRSEEVTLPHVKISSIEVDAWRPPSRRHR